MITLPTTVVISSRNNNPTFCLPLSETKHPFSQKKKPLRLYYYHCKLYRCHARTGNLTDVAIVMGANGQTTVNTVSNLNRIRSNQWPALYLAWLTSIKSESAKTGCRERQKERYGRCFCSCRLPGYSGDNDWWQSARPNQNRVSMVLVKPGPK